MLIATPAARCIESDALAHLVTIAADGSPQVRLVWVGLEGDDIVFASLGPRRKLDNIARDPRVSLSLEGTETNAMGLREYLVVHGTRPDRRGRRARSCSSAWPARTSAPT